MRRFSEANSDALSPEDQRLLNMDPNKLLDPDLLAHLRRQL